MRLVSLFNTGCLWPPTTYSIIIKTSLFIRITIYLISRLSEVSENLIVDSIIPVCAAPAWNNPHSIHLAQYVLPFISVLFGRLFTKVTSAISISIILYHHFWFEHLSLWCALIETRFLIISTIFSVDLLHHQIN